MASIKHLFASIVAIVSFVVTFYSVGKLAVFLSTPGKQSLQNYVVDITVNKKTLLKSTLALLFFDIILIIIFILQHSLMKSDVFKKIYSLLRIEIAERSIFNIASAMTLILLLDNWKTTSSTYALWAIEAKYQSAAWYSLVAVHLILWIIIYGGSLLMDLPEMLGIRQIYYDIIDLAAPISYKCFELRELYKEIRHPSFICITAILWFTNIMSLDRFFLALLWTLYMFVAWNPKHHTVAYQKSQLEGKARLLKLN